MDTDYRKLKEYLEQTYEMKPDSFTYNSQNTITGWYYELFKSSDYPSQFYSLASPVKFNMGQMRPT